MPALPPGDNIRRAPASLIRRIGSTVGGMYTGHFGEPMPQYQGSAGVPRYAPLSSMNALTAHPQLQSTQPIPTEHTFSTGNHAAAIGAGLHNEATRHARNPATATLMAATPSTHNDLFWSIQQHPQYDSAKFAQHAYSQFVRRNPRDVPVQTSRYINGDTVAKYASTPGSRSLGLPGEVYLPDRTDTERGLLWNSHLLANHEFEHARQDVPGNAIDRAGRVPDSHSGGISLPYEVPAGIGDLVFAGRAAKHAITPTGSKQPFQHTVTFPSGYQQDINHMVGRAEQHGYFDGRTMSELLATPEGQQYLRLIASPPASQRYGHLTRRASE